MAHLVLTVVGDDRAGLVQTLADAVAAHDGNWERSELAELAGAFAGIILVSVPDARADDLRDALASLEGLLRVTAHDGAPTPEADPGSPFTFTVLGNDRPGIVREVTSTLTRNGLNIDSFTSRTREAPMFGGNLFEATVVARVPSGTDTADVTAALERLAGEIQVDLSVG